MTPSGRALGLPRGKLLGCMKATRLHGRQVEGDLKKNYTIYEEQGEKSQTEKMWERRCVEVQQDGKGKEGEKRRK